MNFRTEIESAKNLTPISHDDSIVMLGSCFTTEVGERLEHDGFNVTVNPMGALYNPATIAKAIARASQGNLYSANELVLHNGLFHCLDFPTRYTSPRADELLELVNNDIIALGKKLNEATLWIITFGTARVYNFNNGDIAGNCHKLPGTMFRQRLMSVNEIVNIWEPLARDHRIIFTVSPIRHTADGLHGNQLSKSTLLLAIDQIPCSEYFPSYEILIDDLRDYRFYAADMKHPSSVAVDYIYQQFSTRYFSAQTQSIATARFKEYLSRAHRPINKDLRVSNS